MRILYQVIHALAPLASLITLFTGGLLLYAEKREQLPPIFKQLSRNAYLFVFFQV